MAWSRARGRARRYGTGARPYGTVSRPGAAPREEHGAGLWSRAPTRVMPAPGPSHDVYRLEHSNPARDGVIRPESESKAVRVAVLEPRPVRVMTPPTGTPGPARVIPSTARVIGTESYVTQSES